MIIIKGYVSDSAPMEIHFDECGKSNLIPPNQSEAMNMDSDRKSKDDFAQAYAVSSLKSKVKPRPISSAVGSDTVDKSRDSDTVDKSRGSDTVDKSRGSDTVDKSRDRDTGDTCWSKKPPSSTAQHRKQTPIPQTA